MSHALATFSYKGSNINYYEKGAGRPVLLLHGFGASTYTWRYLADELSRNHRIFAIDLKGFGLSDKPANGEYRIEDQSKMVEQFIQEKQLTWITLIGHSYGGTVALVTVTRMIDAGNAGLLDKLVLIDSPAYPQEFPYFIAMLRVPILNYVALGLIPDKLNTRTLLKKVFYDNSKITDEMVDVYSSHLSSPGAYRSLVSTAKQILPDDVDVMVRKFKGIKLPVLIVWGEHDTVVPPWVGTRLSQDMPKAILKVIPDCGHAPPEECPEETIKVVEDFLTQAAP